MPLSYLILVDIFRCSNVRPILNNCYRRVNKKLISFPLFYRSSLDLYSLEILDVKRLVKLLKDAIMTP